MSTTLLLACPPGEVWAALLSDGRLAGLSLKRAGAQGRAGEVLLGRILALKPELPAALVEVGLDRPGFLSAEDTLPRAGIAGLTQGQTVIVQVKKEARADKAAGLTLRPRLAGRLLALTPARPGIAAEKGLDAAEVRRLTAALEGILRAGEGLAVLRAAAGATAAALAAEAETLRARWQAIEAAARDGTPPQMLEAGASPVALALAERAAAEPDAIIVDDTAAFGEARRWLARHAPALVERLALHREAAPLFEAHEVADEVARVLSPRVELPGGAALAIEETAGATVIDVDMGAAASGRGEAERTILASNLAAAAAAGRQIRLRGLAGPIIVDFIGMRRREHREEVRAALQAALADDAEVLGWTRLGHLELVRARREAPIAELIFERVPGGGRRKTALTLALEALGALARGAAATPPRAARLRLHPEVAAALDGPARTARQELELRLGRRIEIAAEPGRVRDTFDIDLG